MVGLDGDDYLAGGAGADTLIANGGADTIVGGSGIDIIDLSETIDTRSGDVVILTPGTSTYDFITGFSNHGTVDQLRFYNSDFGFYDPEVPVGLVFRNDPTDGTLFVAKTALSTANVYVLSSAGNELASGSFAGLQADPTKLNALLADAGAKAGWAPNDAFLADQSFLLLLDDGTDTGVFYVKSDGLDNAITANELQLIGVLNGIADAGTMTQNSFSFG